MASKALKRLYLAHGRAVQDYLVRKLRDSTAAADLAQETFLRVAQAGDDVAIRNERAYLFRTAHNLAIDHIRRIRRQRIDHIGGEQLSELSEDGVPLEDAVASRLMLTRLHDIVAELPERTRRIFILVKIEELTYAETAERLCISESAVQKHLAMGLAHVVQRLKRH